MSLIEDYSFSLDGYEFGLHKELGVTADGFDSGSAEWAVQDGFSPTSGARLFGRDLLHGPTWSFAAFVDEQDASSALKTLGRASAAWRASAVREVPGAFQTLQYRIDNRIRRVYGRSRNFSAPPGNLIYSGMVPVVATFECVNALHYDDTLIEVTLQAVPASTGGLLPPLMDPLTTEMELEPRQGSVVVGGDMPTEAIVTFYGPSLNPWVSVNGWKIQILRALAAGQTCTIDSRSWINTVTMSGGGESGSAAGKLSRTSQLEKARLSPGAASITYGCIDGTGTSRATVKWREAWSSL